jgi:hypothetical protein
MEADFRYLPSPSYEEVMHPENADIYPVLSHVLVAHLPAGHAAAALHQAESCCAAWEFRSFDGAFKAFSTEISRMLDAAQTSGLLTFEIPERHWFFNLREMTQSNLQVMKRLFFFAMFHVFAADVEKKHSKAAVSLMWLRVTSLLFTFATHLGCCAHTYS